MTNPAGNIRAGFYSLLNTAVIYEAVTIPVYEGHGKNKGIAGTSGSYQIILGDQTFNADNTKHSFSGNWTQVIEVRTEIAGSPVRKHADAIASLVEDLVCPTPQQTGLTVTGFQPVNVHVSGFRQLIEDSGSSYLVRSIITISFKLNQV